ncbi:hypothetical protein QQF64_033035 [Cirrhinus molitorella]|uniref:Uncharacterized protein n=1 Tax=Cirrhinus molitorella TaxID=172907 RepID=A0ABR3MSR0_9TELE
MELLQSVASGLINQQMNGHRAVFGFASHRKQGEEYHTQRWNFTPKFAYKLSILKVQNRGDLYSSLKADVVTVPSHSLIGCQAPVRAHQSSENTTKRKGIVTCLSLAKVVVQP